MEVLGPYLFSALEFQPETTGKSHLVVWHWLPFSGSKSDQDVFRVLTNSTWAIHFSKFSSEIEISASTATEIIIIYSKTMILYCFVISGKKEWYSLDTINGGTMWSPSSLTSRRGQLLILHTLEHHAAISTVEDYKQCYYSFRRNMLYSSTILLRIYYCRALKWHGWITYTASLPTLSLPYFRFS